MTYNTTEIQFLRQAVLERNIDHSTREEALNRLLVECGGGRMTGNNFIPRTVEEKAREYIEAGQSGKAILLVKNEITGKFDTARQWVDCLIDRMKEEKKE